MAALQRRRHRLERREAGGQARRATHRRQRAQRAPPPRTVALACGPRRIATAHSARPSRRATAAAPRQSAHVERGGVLSAQRSRRRRRQHLRCGTRAGGSDGCDAAGGAVRQRQKRTALRGRIDGSRCSSSAGRKRRTRPARRAPPLPRPAARDVSVCVSDRTPRKPRASCMRLRASTRRVRLRTRTLRALCHVAVCAAQYEHVGRCRAWRPEHKAVPASCQRTRKAHSAPATRLGPLRQPLCHHRVQRLRAPHALQQPGSALALCGIAESRQRVRAHSGGCTRACCAASAAGHGQGLRAARCMPPSALRPAACALRRNASARPQRQGAAAERGGAAAGGCCTACAAGAPAGAGGGPVRCQHRSRAPRLRAAAGPAPAHAACRGRASEGRLRHARTNVAGRRS